MFVNGMMEFLLPHIYNYSDIINKQKNISNYIEIFIIILINFSSFLIQKKNLTKPFSLQ